MPQWNARHQQQSDDPQQARNGEARKEQGADHPHPVVIENQQDTGVEKAEQGSDED